MRSLHADAGNGSRPAHVRAADSCRAADNQPPETLPPGTQNLIALLDVLIADAERRAAA